MNKITDFLKWLVANEHVQSWFATLTVYVVADCQTILVQIAMGDWSGLTIKLLIVTVARSIVKSLIVFLVPSIKDKVK